MTGKLEVHKLVEIFDARNSCFGDRDIGLRWLETSLERPLNFEPTFGTYMTIFGYRDILYHTLFPFNIW